MFSLRSPQSEATISRVSLFRALQSQTLSLLRKKKDHNSSLSSTGIFLQLLGGRSPVLLTKHSMFGTRSQTSVQSRVYLPSRALWAQVRPRHNGLYSDNVFVLYLRARIHTSRNFPMRFIIYITPSIDIFIGELFYLEISTCLVAPVAQTNEQLHCTKGMNYLYADHQGLLSTCRRLLR